MPPGEPAIGAADRPPSGARAPAAPTPVPATTPLRRSWVRQAIEVARKDLRIEWSSREIVYTMGFLATLVVLVFSFAFIAGEDVAPSPGVTAGILWVAILFSGTVALSRTFDREREGEAVRALLMSPVPGSAIFAGKLAAVAAIMFAVELAVTPLCAVFFSAAVGAHPARLALLLLLGTIGFATVGVVFAAALLRSRSRDALLGALLYPVVVPVLLAGARGTTALLDPDAVNLSGAVFWTQFLFTVDVVFVAVGLWAFEPVLTGE